MLPWLKGHEDYDKQQISPRKHGFLAEKSEICFFYLKIYLYTEFPHEKNKFYQETIIGFGMVSHYPYSQKT